MAGGGGSSRPGRLGKLASTEEPFTIALPKSFVRRLQMEAKVLQELQSLRRENLHLRKELRVGEAKFLRRAIVLLKQMILTPSAYNGGLPAAKRGPKIGTKQSTLHWSKRPGVDPQKVKLWQLRRMKTQGMTIAPKYQSIDGKQISPESRKKMGAATKSRWQRYRDNKRKGLVPLKPRGSFSEEALQKMREAGKKGAAIQAAQRAAMKQGGAKYTAEGRAKMAEAGRRTAQLLKDRAAKKKAEAAAAEHKAAGAAGA